MPLKIQLNGQKQQLTGPGKPLVVFANGQKKLATKGVTFIHGVKQVLWSANELHVDYVPNIYNLTSTTYIQLFWTSNNTAFLTTERNANFTSVYKLDISNKTAPILLSQVDLGRIVGFSAIDSTPDNMVYYAAVSSQKVQQINVNPTTATINATNPLTLSEGAYGTVSGGLLGTNSWLGVFNLGATRGQLRLNTEIVGTWGWTPSGSVSGSYPLTYMYKKNATSFLVPTFDQNQNYVSEATATGLQTRITGVDFNVAMTDPENNNIICAGTSGFAIYAPDYSLIAQTENTENYTMYYLLGKIRDYYYVVQSPISGKATDKNLYLKVYGTDGTLFTQQVLDLQAQLDSRYSSHLVRCVPHISQTGALGFVFYPDSSLVIINGY